MAAPVAITVLVLMTAATLVLVLVATVMIVAATVLMAVLVTVAVLVLFFFYDFFFFDDYDNGVRATRCEVSQTSSWNSSVADSPGAVKVGVAVSAPVRLTVDPPIWVQA